ncbi:protein phosphatase CheZ [Propionivibrio sp.]|uniref:protein phosphatase CheZ n=1 Tax=Propionivibrio sp. TaxID=2212460 RepID=UPI003BF15D8B
MNQQDNTIQIPGTVAEDHSQRTFQRIGQIMRQLNDALHELGYDKLIEKTLHAIPDTRDRLAYIASLTEQAACRVLNATDVAIPLQDKLQASAKSLSRRWTELDGNCLSPAQARALTRDTRAFLDQQVPQDTTATTAQLMEILMAQDFQDLTGQVIKKIVILAQNLESQLMEVLVELIPDSRRKDEANNLLNGPLLNTASSGEAAASKGEVDDLLNSLGF